MTTFQRILVATDFSETSAHAVKYAIELSQTFSAELHVLHVLETEVPLMASGIAYLPPDVREEIEKDAANKLEQVISPADRSKLAVTLSMSKGTAFVEIIRYARDNKMDLIVLGTHGRGVFAHVLLGNVAEKVVRKAPCPVLTIRHPQHEFKMP